MIIFLKKKINLILEYIFIFFSIQNLSEFNDFGLLNNDEGLDALNINDKSEDLILLDEDQYFAGKSGNIQRYELTKKENQNNPYEEVEKSLDVANYLDVQRLTSL